MCVYIYVYIYIYIYIYVCMLEYRSLLLAHQVTFAGVLGLFCWRIRCFRQLIELLIPRMNMWCTGVYTYLSTHRLYALYMIYDTLYTTIYFVLLSRCDGASAWICNVQVYICTYLHIDCMPYIRYTIYYVYYYWAGAMGPVPTRGYPI